jgi:predicted aspartyl protease
MSQFRAIVTLYPRAEGEAPRLDALVDTGGGYTVVPRAVLETHGSRAATLTRHSVLP